MQADRPKRRAHEELTDDIRRQIRDGVLSPDTFLPPERELALRYGVSSRAVREGLVCLEAEGLIQRQQGRGTKVLLPAVADAKADAVPRTGNVAVIFQGRVRDASTAEDFDALQQAFQQEGFGTMLYVADNNLEKEAAIVRQLAADKVPGIVLYSTHPVGSDAHLREALDAGTRIVAFDHDFPQLACNFVGIDDEQAAGDAVQHLLRLGCAELLMINSARNWTTHTLRQRGFEEAARWGRAVPTRTIRVPAYHFVDELDEFLKRELTAIMAEARRPLGVVAWWDAVALKAIDIFRSHGWSVPGDAKVIGFANDQGGELADVPLTTIAIPREEVAQLASAALISQMRDPVRQPQRIRLKARMVIRESCGTYQPARQAQPEASRPAE